MTWFSLPVSGRDDPPAFTTLEDCNAWLASQPLANAPLMQEVLAEQLDKLNGWQLSARERYKILESLRKPIFAIENESSKRYEFRPLPLSAVEQKAFDASCRLWRQLATGYLHCLRACLDKDPAISEHHAKIAHRTLTSLRLEQMSRYRGGAALPGQWWRLLHAAYASADQLSVAGSPVSDRLLPETRESTPGGQYAMAILLHLSRPHELSRNQIGAVVRWLARWREHARIFPTPAAAGDSRVVVIDLASDEPVHNGRGTPANGRWLAIDPVLGKLKRRLKSLRDGKSPEELNLGNVLPADACMGLLQFLHGAFQSPPAPAPASSNAIADLALATTLETIHQLLGGTAIREEGEPSSLSNRKLHEQIAIFGHVVRSDTVGIESRLEPWHLLLDQNGLMILRRPAGAQGERLGNRCLAALKLADGSVRLAVFRSLVVQDDNSLLAWAKTLTGEASAVLATGRERVTNRVTPYPAVFLTAAGQPGMPPSVFVPAGATAKLTRLDVDGLPDGLKAGAPIDRGSNYERLGCA